MSDEKPPDRWEGLFTALGYAAVVVVVVAVVILGLIAGACGLFGR